MDRNSSVFSVGYFVKMFPRLSETFILNEILELERRGVEVVIFSIRKPNEGRFHSQLADLKARVMYLDELDPKKWQNWIADEWSILSSCSSNIWQLLEGALENNDFKRVEWIWMSAWAASQARRLGLSHLHAHFATLPSTVAYFAHRISGIPFSFTAHAKDIFVYDTDSHLLREKSESASSIITVTNYNRRYLTEKLPTVNERKIRVLHNGINKDYFRHDDSIKREPDLILAVGRLVLKKGFNYLLEACSLLKKKGLQYRCLIVGDGNEKANLEQQRQDLQLESEVTFTGPMNLDEVSSLMRRATLICLPCVIGPDNNVDALPTVLLESLMCGLPIVSTTISGVPEIVDSGVDGLLVEPADAKSLSRAIERLLNSPELREEYATKGRIKAAKKFDLEKNVGALLNIFLETRRDTENNQATVQAKVHSGATHEE